MPTPQKTVKKENGGISIMKEQDIMLKLTDLLMQEQLISSDEKLKLRKLIQSRRSS